MVFNSADFLIFFPCVTMVYFLLPKKMQQYWLLLASYYFYMCWNAKYIILLLFSTMITYISGILIEYIKGKKYEKSKELIRKKIVVVLSFILNLSVLFFFKYINFGLSILTKAFAFINIEVQLPQYDILLPVGISFFIFQALSYTIDVYRDEIYAEKNFFRYALFVSFFPQLVAGPIERSKNLLKQLSQSKKFSFERMQEGLLLMLWGLFLKMCVADRIAIFVDCVYNDPARFKGYYIAVATILFAFQIYCDFAGYSIIAMGSAKILGFQLIDNFNAPYMATSVNDFWRRWHISLTTWFRDYLYFPLGGGRKGKLKKYLNKMIVFFTSGLWHGASVSFIIWGVLNGLYQIAEEILQPIRNRVAEYLNLSRESIGHKMMKRVTTFLLIDFSWIFFRAGGAKRAIEIIKCMITGNNPWILFNGDMYLCGLDRSNFLIMLLGIGLLLFADSCKNRGVVVRNVILKQDTWCKFLVMYVAIIIIVVFGIWGSTYDAASFIYFQF